ncbi:aldehyde dehydrogenase (NADP(+)) [Rhodococcoides yunnanense]|uniref:aldehyde dehydrogenase (NADP(+)) n=1 Tax=Rhodococcoides yunnanense TaxID=278209 RepID=UPI0022B0B199|nr:aldehyde dehydrogenase (NADP(+)) [Rhodococcus yunnanensis]MCZ4276223.1 aldehyde dehydrogenase (NADP(+)) [Rhodococcus yunnanensis]
MTTATHTSLTGDFLVGGIPRTGAGAPIVAIDPDTGSTLEPTFHHARTQDVRDATRIANDAFDTYRQTTSQGRAQFLDTIADNIIGLGDELIDRAAAESGLPRARLLGERGRTVGQLRLFAAVLREGSWNGARIDPAVPDREPVPRSDIRLRMVPLGPVVVFAASNFPLAFSVAGGDTASALAAGCPVIVKAHDAHPGTSELVARAISTAVAEHGLPEGTFSMLFGKGQTIGVELVTDPAVAAVGFTGSRGGGLALTRAAAEREVPIPVYAEMSSINPVVLLPGALRESAATLGTSFVQSLTMGAGQFCTNPGLVFAVVGAELGEFLNSAAAAVGAATGAAMLTPGIAEAYASGQRALREHADVDSVAAGRPGSSVYQGLPELLVTDAENFLAEPALHAEVFGATSLVVRCADLDQLHLAVNSLEGQLTATVHAAPVDHADARKLVTTLERKVGRILFNGWPTGVEVGHAMVHGGPFPATSDSRTTSVGSLAIDRFLRPVSYQDVPADLLPSAIADGNPDNIWRRVDGSLTQE